METQQTQPPMMNAGQQPIAGPPPPTPPRKTMSRALLWTLIGGGVVLVVLGIIAATFVVGRLSQPTKQDYQMVVDKYSQLRNGYSDYTTSTLIPRARLNLNSALENRDISLENYNNPGQNKPLVSVDQQALEKIEAEERKVVKEIAKSERELDELVAQLDDRDVSEQYAVYVKQRAKVYGEAESMEQYVEASIQMYRFYYTCSELERYDNFTANMPMDTLKRATLYLESCLASAKITLAEEAVLSDEQKALAKATENYLSDMVSVLRKMVSDGAVDMAVIDNIRQKYQSSLGSDESGEEEVPGGIDSIIESMEGFIDTLIEKRDAARGDYGPAGTTESEGLPGIRR